MRSRTIRSSFAAADELEALLASSPDADALIRFYYRRLEHVRHEEGRPGERLRLWDQLGELCLQLGRPDDAITAFEVGLTLAPEDLERRQRLADLYFGDPAHDASAIAAAPGDPARRQAPRSPRTRRCARCTPRTEQPEKARACDEALEQLGTHLLEERIDGLFDASGARPAAHAGATRARAPLANEDFLALARLDVDLPLSALFALVAPPFGVERARMRPPAPVPSTRARGARRRSPACSRRS